MGGRGLSGRLRQQVPVAAVVRLERERRLVPQAQLRGQVVLHADAMPRRRHVHVDWDWAGRESGLSEGEFCPGADQHSGDGHSYVNGDAYGNTDADANSDANRDADPDSHGHGNSHAHGNADSNGNRDDNPHADRDAHPRDVRPGLRDSGFRFVLWNRDVHSGAADADTFSHANGYVVGHADVERDTNGDCNCNPHAAVDPAADAE